MTDVASRQRAEASGAGVSGVGVDGAAGGGAADIDDEIMPPVSLRKRLTSNRWVVLGLQMLLGAVVLSVWQWGNVVDELYVSKPSAIFDAIVRWQEDGVLFPNIMVSLQTTVYGFGIGGILGLIVGFSLGTSDFASRIFRPFVTALNSIPRLALVPLFLIWFGLGMSSKVALVATVVFFLIFYNTYAGVRDVDRQLVDVLRLMKAKRRHVYLKVTLPSAMTWIIAGMRVSVPYAMVAAVTAEMLASNRGMGFLLQRSAGQFYTPGVFGAIIVMIVMSITLMFLVTVLERFVLSWKPPTPY